MTFEITMKTPHATKTYLRASRDGAEYLFRRVVYGVLKSRALLDRPIARVAMRRADDAWKSDCFDLTIHVQDVEIEFRAV